MPEKASLKKYNSFGIDVKADEIIRIKDLNQLRNWHLKNRDKKFLVLGEGSNVLFLSDFKGTILLNEIQGKEIIEEKGDRIVLHVKGGEKWHDLVMWAVENNYGGIENLALIPGKTGTAPIQNIGAYGVEIKDVINKVYAYDFKTGEEVVFSKDDCRFGYRDSIFKKPENKNRYFITGIDIEVSRANHKLNTSYGAITKLLNEKGIHTPKPKDIAEAVIEIRRTKLPDPQQIGNAGSFFKNPIVSKEKFEAIRKLYPDMPYYKIDARHIKIPAGWLIEKAGFKGKRFGNTGVHDKQALVLINLGNASGKEVKNLAEKIIAEINKKFGIQLQPEVNFIE